MNDNVEIKCNYKEINNKLLQLQERAQNMRPLMKSAALIMKNYVDENFETQGEHSGDKWKEWSDEYKEHREKIGRGDGRILSLEGELRESISSIVTDESAMVGSNKEYAAIHNFGGDIKKRGGNGSFEMDARPYAVWTDDLQELIEEEIEGELQNIIDK